MRVISLQSGSNGNCIYLEAGSARLLLDAGISGLQAQRRMRAFGADIRDVDALIVSHDHSDHICCAGIYQRRYGLVLHATRDTLNAGQRRCSLGPLGKVRHFRSGSTLRFDGTTVRTLPTSHDAADGVGFVIEAEGKRLGILTDLGCVFEGLRDVIASLDAVILESNYDPDMLEAGGYPAFLKTRIRGDGGHLSNVEAAELLAGSGRSLKWACLAHLSHENNTPELAVRTHRRIVGTKLPIHVASRYAPSAVLEL